MLTEAEVEAFDECRVDLPAKRTQHVIGGLDRAEDHTVLHVDQAPAPYGLDHLRIEQLRGAIERAFGHGPWARAACRRT